MENNPNSSFFKRAQDADASSDNQSTAPAAERRPRVARTASTDEKPQRANRPYSKESKNPDGAPKREGGFKKEGGFKREGGFKKEGGFKREGGFKKEGGFKSGGFKKEGFRRDDDRGGFKKEGFRRDDDRGGYNNDRGGYDEDRPRKGEAAPLQAPENIIFGIHPVREALEAGVAVEKIYVKKGTDAAEGIIEYADARGIVIQEVPIEKLDKLTRRNRHQGIVAVIPAIEYADINQILEDVMAKERPALFVVLDSVTDIRNFGAIARTAECVGADAIIVSAKNSAPVNAEAIKSSAGALSQIPVCRVGSLRNTLRTIQMAGVQLVAATEKSTALLYESDMRGSVAIIMGAEDAGISVDILKMCDQKISIPMLGHIESLNVSAAAAVILYEAVRQRFEAVDAE